MKITLLDKDFLQSASNHNTNKKTSTNSSQSVVLTIGNFDGLHLGHQAMINQAIDLATEQNMKSAVMVFEPMPKEFFAPTHAPARLMNRIETQHVFSSHSHAGQTIDELIIADFTEEFRSLSATQFANLLKHTLNVRAVVLGDDFRFGHDRTGDSDFLSQHGIQVINMHTITDHAHANERISSTRIRKLLAEGKLKEANQLLGRDYCMIGTVQHGDKIGRTLNFPTANISLDRIKPALHGVFAVDVQVVDKNGDVIADAWQGTDDNQGILGLAQHSLFGTANIGTRPAVDGKEWRLEVYFPEFVGDLYDKLLKVRFLHFLHGERNYNSLEELKAGINDDVEQLIHWRKQQTESNKPMKAIN